MDSASTSPRASAGVRAMCRVGVQGEWLPRASAGVGDIRLGVGDAGREVACAVR